MQEHDRRSRSHKTDEPGRRDFLKAGAVVAGAGLAAVSGVATAARGRSQAESRRVPGYHGYVSFQDDNRISICTVDPATGKLAWQEDVAVDGGPAPLAIDPARNILFVGKRVGDEIASYRIDKSTGGLSFVGTVPLQGEPVHLSTDRTGRFVLSAYWHQSTIAVHAVDDNGVATFPPIEWRYTAPGCHSIHTDPSNRFVFVPHTARPGQPNGIFQFRFDESTGRLTPNDPPLCELQATLGPRHICFHPTRGRRLLLRRAGQQRHGVCAGYGGGNARAVPDDLVSAGRRTARSQHVLPDSDPSLREIPVRPQPRPRQRRELYHRFIHRPADGNRLGSHGAETQGLQPGSGRPLSFRRRSRFGPTGLLRGQPGQRCAHPPGDL